MRSFGLVFALLAALVGSACSSSGAEGRDASGSGGTGPGAGSGGTTAGSGGAAGGTGGAGGTATGGASGSGGATGSGGVPGSGGTTGSGGAATGGSAGATDGGSGDVAAGGAWPAVTDFAARGPFAIQREMNVGPGGAYDIVRPMPLGAEGRKHPIVSWNNGTLYLIARYQNMLDHWASHGFVVMGGHTNTTAGGMVHKVAIDWLVAENARTGSAYFGVLDVRKIGAAGHSQGGGASISAAANTPGTTGIVTTMPLMPISSYQRAELGRLAGSSMLIVSATDDARSNTVADQAFTDVTKEFVDAQWKGVHEDAMNPGIHGATVAWLRYQLMGDLTAKAQFYPAGTCALCRDTAWMRVRHKNPPP